MIIPPPIIVPTVSKDSAIFGIGIAASVIKIETQAQIRDFFNPYVIPDKDFDPDYNSRNPSANSRWNGRMSSALQGMPVMCSLTFKGSTYLDFEGIPVTIPTITFETVVISARQGKKIVKTETGGNNVDVKEYNGRKDWSLEVRAIVTANAPLNKDITKRNLTGTYPRENMEAIMEVINAPISIPIECWYLEMLGIKYLMIDDGVLIEQVEGEYSTQRLIIPCVSDEPLIISIGE